MNTDYVFFWQWQRQKSDITQPFQVFPPICFGFGTSNMPCWSCGCGASVHSDFRPSGWSSEEWIDKETGSWKQKRLKRTWEQDSGKKIYHVGHQRERSKLKERERESKTSRYHNVLQSLLFRTILYCTLLPTSEEACKQHLNLIRKEHVLALLRVHNSCWLLFL